MANRAMKYGTTYVPAYRMAVRWEEIQQNIRDEQAAFREAQAVAQAERDRLNQLTDALALEGASPDTLAAYLAAVRADEAAAVAARSSAGRAVTGKQQGLNAIVDTIGTSGPTANQVDAFISALQAGPRLSDAELGRLMSAAKLTPTEKNRAVKANAARPTAGPGVAPAPSRQAVEGFLLTQMTSPSAAVDPAMQGQVEARRTSRSEALPTLSQDQVLNAYLRALESGRGGDVAARFTAALGAQLPADADPGAALAEAERIYNRVRDEGSFVRKDARLFNDGWLQTADALREANELAESIKPGYTDPAREAARRELVARGLNPDDKYVGLTGDRRYNYLHAADRIYGEVGGDVKPATPDQVKIAEFVAYLKRESDRTGKPLELKKIERELGKTFKGKALDEAVGFSLALVRSQSEKPEDRKTQADLQREAELTAQRLKEIEASKAAAELERNRIESELQAEIENLTRQAAATAAEQGRLTRVESVPVRRTGEEVEADAARTARREDRFGLAPRSRVTGEPFTPPTALRSRESLEAELFPEPPGPRTVTLRSGPGRDVAERPPASPFDPLQVPSLDQRATQTVMQSLRSGGDLRTNALRLRALGYSNEQIRALVAAARSASGSVDETIRRVTMEAEDVGRGMFVDWSDPARTVYRRNPDGTITGPDGRPITNRRAVEALSVVERGDTPENRAALARIQKPVAQNPAGTGRVGRTRAELAELGADLDPTMESPAFDVGAAPPPAETPEQRLARLKAERAARGGK